MLWKTSSIKISGGHLVPTEGFIEHSIATGKSTKYTFLSYRPCFFNVYEIELFNKFTKL